MTEVKLEDTTIGVLSALPGALRALLSSVPAHAVEVPIDDGWSAKDVVAHLLDVEGVAFTDRIRRILREDRPFIRPIDPFRPASRAGLRVVAARPPAEQVRAASQ
jgi:hypothetical protein